MSSGREPKGGGPAHEEILHLQVGHVGSEAQKNILLVLLWAGTSHSLGPVYEFVCISFRTDNLNCFRVS